MPFLYLCCAELQIQVNTIFHNMMTLETKSNDTKCILLHVRHFVDRKKGEKKNHHTSPHHMIRSSALASLSDASSLALSLSEYMNMCVERVLLTRKLDMLWFRHTHTKPKTNKKRGKKHGNCMILTDITKFHSKIVFGSWYRQNDGLKKGDAREEVNECINFDHRYRFN